MEKKIECKIVQDLLLGYTDEILNEESKKVVEKHLSECDICQKRLKEIKKDIEENDVTQEKEIDYLKKIRIKNRIKSILIAIGILFIIIFIIFLRKFFIVNNFTNKAKNSLEAENFYKETIQNISSDKAFLTKEYYKNGKYKIITEVYSDEGVTVLDVEYATLNSDERIIINDEEKIVTVKKGECYQSSNIEKNLKYVPFNESYSFVYKVIKAFGFSIHSSNYDLGKEYYVLRNQFDKDNKWEAWIDKQTGLPLKIIDAVKQKIYFEGTDIVKEEINVNTEYRYKFDVVTDEDVTVPDYTGYEVKYVKTERDDNKIENIDIENK